MSRKFLFWPIFFYLIIGFIWLVAGTWLLNHIQNNHPSAHLQYLWDIKNIVFLLASVIGAVYLMNSYYKRLLLKERVLNGQLQKGKVELNALLNIYEIVTQATSDVIWDYDIINDELTWLSGYKEVFGYKDKLVATNAFWNMKRIHEEDRDAVIAAFKNVLAEKKQKWNAEYRYQCKDGSYKYVLDRGYLICDQKNEPVRMIGAIQDINKRKLYGQQLEEQNARLKKIAWLNSHEIRRPLCNITGLIPLIKASAGNKEDLKHLLTLLEKASTELDETISKINETSQS
nr:PAS domain-containing protein [Mucilaginibacter sp. L294]